VEQKSGCRCRDDIGQAKHSSPPSGAGKSSFLQLVDRLSEPTGGTGPIGFIPPMSSATQ
jgi:ABC-type iron transport system FetAB ATPase subunit